MINSYLSFFGAWYWALIFTAWFFGGAVHYAINQDRVQCQPQKIVYALICGPLIWTVRTFGFVIDGLDVVFAGFKKWLYTDKKPENK